MIKKYDFTIACDVNHDDNWIYNLVIKAWTNESKELCEKYNMHYWKYASYLTISENHPLFNKPCSFWHDYCHGGCTYFETKYVESTNTYGSDSLTGRKDTGTVRIIGMDFSHLYDNYDVDPVDGIPPYIIRSTKVLLEALDLPASDKPKFESMNPALYV
jgi:hypothetical protein